MGTFPVGVTSPTAIGGGLNWVDRLERHSYEIPDRRALVCGARSLTWSQLQDRVVRLAGALAHYGVRRGDRVAVLMGNRAEYVETLIAVHRLGGIAVPVNFRLAASEIAFVLTHSGARLLVVDGERSAAASDALGEAGTDVGVLVVDGPGKVRGDRYEEAVEAAHPEPERTALAERDPALIMYTSGTTGRPKGAVLSHLNLAVQAETLTRCWRLHRNDDVNLCVSPLFHIAALGSVVPFVLSGSCVVIEPSGGFDAGRLAHTVADNAVTHLFLVPAQWQQVVADPAAAEDMAGLRTVGWGAAPASTTLLEALGAAFPGAAVVANFGQTEMSPVTCVLDGEDAVQRLGSVGRPVPAVRARVVDDDMADVPAGAVGEIVYRGAGLMAGYWDDPVATADAMEGGWFHSGDLVRVDEGGFVYVVDRKKDMIISGGENIYCAEVENVIAAHPSVAEAAVVGAPHERWGETPVAVVVPDGAPPSLDELVAWCRARSAAYKSPTRLLIVDELPRNAGGKVVKPALRDRVRAAALDDEA